MNATETMRPFADSTTIRFTPRVACTPLPLSTPPFRLTGWRRSSSVRRGSTTTRQPWKHPHRLLSASPTLRRRLASRGLRSCTLSTEKMSTWPRESLSRWVFCASSAVLVSNSFYFGVSLFPILLPDSLVPICFNPVETFDRETVALATRNSVEVGFGYFSFLLSYTASLFSEIS